MIWLIIAAIGSLLSLLVFFKTRNANALVLTFVIPFLLLFVGLVITIGLGLSLDSPAWIVRSITNYPLRDSPNLEVVEATPYRHSILVIDVDRDRQSYKYELEDLPFYVLDTDGQQTLVMREYVANPKNIWIYKSFLMDPRILAQIEVK